MEFNHGIPIVEFNHGIPYQTTCQLFSNLPVAPGDRKEHLVVCAEVIRTVRAEVVVTEFAVIAAVQADLLPVVG